jgi:hypothetical protein
MNGDTSFSSIQWPCLEAVAGWKLPPVDKLLFHLSRRTGGQGRGGWARGVGDVCVCVCAKLHRALASKWVKGRWWCASIIFIAVPSTTNQKSGARKADEQAEKEVEV